MTQNTVSSDVLHISERMKDFDTVYVLRRPLQESLDFDVCM